MSLLGLPPPADPLGPPPDTLVELIHEARLTWAEELWIPIDQSRPPITRGGHSAADYYWQQEPSSALGRTLSASLLRLLGYQDSEEATQFSILRAESAVRDTCRKQHRIARGHAGNDGEQRLLCGELYRAAVIHGLDMEATAESADVSPEVARKFLKQACASAWQSRREWLIYAARERRLEDISRSYRTA